MSSLIHSARPIVTPVANIVCFVFLDLKSGDGRTDGRPICAKTIIPTGPDFGLAEWINIELFSVSHKHKKSRAKLSIYAFLICWLHFSFLSLSHGKNKPWSLPTNFLYYGFSASSYMAIFLCADVVIMNFVVKRQSFVMRIELNWNKAYS